VVSRSALTCDGAQAPFLELYIKQRECCVALSICLDQVQPLLIGDVQEEMQ
jgi:hypothetical protein